MSAYWRFSMIALEPPTTPLHHPHAAQLAWQTRQQFWMSLLSSRCATWCAPLCARPLLCLPAGQRSLWIPVSARWSTVRRTVARFLLPLFLALGACASQSARSSCWQLKQRWKWNQAWRAGGGYKYIARLEHLYNLLTKCCNLPYKWC